MEFQRHSKIEDLVKQYKDGDKDSMSQILEMFYPIRQTYCNLIFNPGHTVKESNNIKTFLRVMFGRTYTEKGLYKKFKNIRNVYDGDQFSFDTDLCIILMKMLNRYENTDKNFVTYVNAVFPFEVGRLLTTHLKDPMSWEDNMISLDEYGINNPIITKYYCFVGQDALTELIAKQDLVIRPEWIEGETCSEAFKDLTPANRKILYLYYENDMVDRIIADKMCLKRNTVNKKRARAVESISKFIYGGV